MMEPNSDMAWTRYLRPVLLLFGLVLLAVFSPGLLVILVVLPILIVIGLVLTLGPIDFWDLILSGFERLSIRAPKAAEALRQRMDKLAPYWDAFLDRFPEEWVEELYFPDFNSWSIKRRDQRNEGRE